MELCAKVSSINIMEIFSPAKINLFIGVTGKRKDGYHDLETIMCRIGLYDRMVITFGVEKTSLTCSDPDVPENSDNLALRAADLFFREARLKKGLQRENISISIFKHIPVGGGLGGGSGNAASTLSALNRRHGNLFSLNELMKMGASIGADVPFFIYKKPAFATGAGDRLQPFDRFFASYVLVIYPGFSLSTAMIFKKLNLGLTKCKQNDKNYFCVKKRWFNVPHDLCNDLETVAEVLCPEIEAMKKELLNQGASGSLMSGSGSCVFGLFSDYMTIKAAYDAISKKYDWTLHVADMLV